MGGIRIKIDCLSLAGSKDLSVSVRSSMQLLLTSLVTLVNSNPSPVMWLLAKGLVGVSRNGEMSFLLFDRKF